MAGALRHGTHAASVTPLRDGGDRLDEDAFGPLTDFFAGHGLAGILALGTMGEGLLLETDERRRAAELFVGAASGRLDVAVHCGAQTTRDTVALAAHAAEIGATAVAVISPPYFPLDGEELLAHLAAAAAACAPLPFYVYEFARASGYAVPLDVLDRLREAAPNLAGLKVSDRPWESFAPYLVEGLDVFVGPESLIDRGLAGGGVGAVSALASIFPEVVAEAVATASPAATERAGTLREGLDRFARHATGKYVLGLRGVPIREDVRRPLRPLTDEERAAVRALVEPLIG